MTPDTDNEERVRREDAEVERSGAAWAERSDAYLVGYVAENRSGQFHTPAIVEMQRRAMVTIVEFRKESSRQSNKMIRLTWWIAGLTVVLGLLAAAQLWETFGPNKP